MLDACDRLGMLVMDETFDMWAQTKSDDDYALRFADWWEADVEAMVRKDVNHPSVVLYSIGNEIPDGVDADRPAPRPGAGREGAVPRRHPLRHPGGHRHARRPARDLRRRSATSRPRPERRRGHRRQHRDHQPGRAAWTRRCRSPVVGDKTEEAFSHLDVAGYNYMDTRFEIDRELLSRNRVIVATETHPAHGRHGLGRRAPATPTSSATSRGPAGTTSARRASAASSTATQPTRWACRRSTATTRGWRPGAATSTSPGHRRPQSYYREIVFGLPHRPLPRRATARAPRQDGRARRARGRGATWCRAGAGTATRAQPVVVEVYADADEVELLVNGESARPAARRRRATGSSAEFETTYEPGELEAVAWRDGKEVGRTSLRSATGPVRLDVRADRTEIRADPSDLAFVELTLVDEAGTVHDHRRPTASPSRSRGPACSRAWPAPTRDRGALHRRRPARPSTAGPSPSSAPPGRARSRVRGRRRTAASRAGARASSGRP